MSFSLSKWYMDCATESGDVTILYTGSARWGGFPVHYSSSLESTGPKIVTSQSLRPCRGPEVDTEDGIVRWRGHTWRALDCAPLRETVFDSPAGRVDWHCFLPRAAAHIDGRCGLGYVERLDMTIAPWNLPLSTLRWGRFLSGSDSIVWIDWLAGKGRGGLSASEQSPSPRVRFAGDYLGGENHNRRIVYRNSELCAPSRLDDDAIEWPDGAQLAFDRSLVLRDGPLGTTALTSIAGLPGRILAVRETKWRSRARLIRPDSSARIEGWAIHEIVEWPPS